MWMKEQRNYGLKCSYTRYYRIFMSKYYIGFGTPKSYVYSFLCDQKDGNMHN